MTPIDADDPDLVPNEGWRDWSEVVANDLTDPAFAVLVRSIDADQDAWAEE